VHQGTLSRVPYTGEPPTSRDAGAFRRSIRWTWLVSLAIVLFGVGALLYGVYTVLVVGGHDGTSTTAEIERAGGNGAKPVVSFTTAAGERVTADLREAAATYQNGGPVSVVYDPDDPTTVYDANAKGGEGQWPSVLAGAALIAFGVWCMRRASRWRQRVLTALDGGLTPYDVMMRRSWVTSPYVGKAGFWSAEVHQRDRLAGRVLIAANAKKLPEGDLVPGTVWRSEADRDVVVVDTGTHLVWQRDPVRNLLAWVSSDRLELDGPNG
jgi:hypothetical protein